MKILENLPEVGLLSREDEITFADDGSEESLNELVLHHMREAWVYTRQVCRGKLPDDEIYSLCYIALRKSAKNFTADGARFFAYSKPYLRGELSREWASKDTVKHASLHETEVTSTVIPGQIPGRAEGFSRAELAWVEPDFQSIIANERLALVKPVIDKVLSDHEKMILTLNYESGFSFTTISELLSISRSAVGETHARAIGKVRSELSKRNALLE